VASCGESLRDDVDNSDTGSLGQLAPPNDLSATDPDEVGCGSVELTWDPVDYATAYYVYRSSTPSFPGPDGLIGLAEGNTYLDNQFDDDQFNVAMYYWLESVGEYCDSPVTHSQLAEGLSRPPLIAPTAVRSSDGTVCKEVWIDWDEDVNAQYFEVWRNTVENSNTALLLTDPATAPTTNVYVDSGDFDSATEYYYWVKTVNTCGTSSFSNSDIGYPADIPSSPIISVTQGSICDYITLNWGTIQTANRYQVFRSEIVDEAFPQYMAEVLTPITTWTDVNVLPDVDYYYWVAALNDCTTSGTSGDGKIGWIGELAVPTNVQASQLEFCGGITITWDVVDNATNYNLYRLPDGPDGDDETQSELIGSSDGATSFVDSNIDPSNQYYYWVKSVNYTICGESDFSSSAIGQSLPPVIVPSEVSATFNEQCGQITIAWVHDEPLTTYTVHRNESDNVGGAVIVATNLTDTIFVDSQDAGDFTPGIPYFYWVVANNDCGNSNYSQPAALGQAGDDPAQPTGLTASPSCNSVILNWTPVDGASSYQLIRRTEPTSFATIVYEGNQTTHTDVEIVSGVTYYYTATASNSCSTSEESVQTSSSATGPPPPTGVSATDDDVTLNCLVSVTWDSVEDATNYMIYRGTDSDVTNTFQIGQQLQSPFIDTSPLPTAYYFVKAITPGCGEGGFSTGDIGSPFEGLPNPGGVNATNGTTCGGITISWDTVSGASTYCVYRSVSEGPQTATLQACSISGLSWLDDDIDIGTPYWYWVTSESSGDESCNLGIPDQGWSSEELGGIQNLTASQCEPNYIEVEWYGVNSCFDVKRDSTVIATCTQSVFRDLEATGTHNYYVRPQNSCGALGTWEGPVVGILASCLGNDLPEGLLGTDPGDPMIIIVPSEINNPSNRKGPSAKGPSAKGPSAKGTSVGDSESIVNGDDPSIATPPWSLCLVGDAEITTSPILNLGESKWSLPLGGNWRLVGREGYADLFFLVGSDWEHVRSLRVEEVESGIAQSLLEDGIAAVVGTVPEAGTDVLITGVSSEDCDKDGIPDGCEILLGLARDLNIDGVPDSCAADLNGDGTVDSIDLLEVLQNFGTSINMYGDVTGNGVVDQSDVLAVLMEMSN
jgi:fibronectin type 3 domain-containing protein